MSANCCNLPLKVTSTHQNYFHMFVLTHNSEKRSTLLAVPDLPGSLQFNYFSVVYIRAAFSSTTFVKRGTDSVL